MPVPRAPHVSLADEEQRRLESIVRAHSTPQALSFRCQLILRRKCRLKFLSSLSVPSYR